MRIPVTEGTGFIGPGVVTRLIRMGHEVAVFRGAGPGRAGLMDLHSIQNQEGIEVDPAQVDYAAEDSALASLAGRAR